MVPARLRTAFGETKSELAWSNDPRCVITRKAFRDRLKRGMGVEEALTSPPTATGSAVGNKGVLHEAFGETKTLPQWAVDPRCRVSRTGLRQRLAKDQPLEEALVGAPLRGPDYLPKAAFDTSLPTWVAWAADPRCVVPYQTLLVRLARGMDPVEAMTTSPDDLRRTQTATYPFDGDDRTLTEMIADPRCSLGDTSTLHARIHKLGMPVHEAVTRPRIERSSLAEEQLIAFVRGLGVEVVRHDRSVAYPREIDLYIPGHRLGVEYNGVYWHSERYLARSYHHDKWEACRAAGVQLVQVWQDDYSARPELIHAGLAHKLGLTPSRTFARNTVAGELGGTAANEFLDRFHIQGGVGASVHVGLGADGTLVAVCSFTRGGGHQWDLTRYATATSVVGGFTKCLAYFTRNHQWSAIKTFSDHCVSDGGLYRKAGFALDAVLPPDYRYVVGGRRIHKFSYRLDRFRRDPHLLYEEGLTERQLAELNDLPRIWDAGKTRWVLRP